MSNNPFHVIYLKVRELRQYYEFKKLPVWSLVSSVVCVAQQILADAETKRPVVHTMLFAPRTFQSIYEAVLYYSPAEDSSYHCTAP